MPRATSFMERGSIVSMWASRVSGIEAASVRIPASTTRAVNTIPVKCATVHFEHGQTCHFRSAEFDQVLKRITRATHMTCTTPHPEQASTPITLENHGPTSTSEKGGAQPAPHSDTAHSHSTHEISSQRGKFPITGLADFKRRHCPSKHHARRVPAPWSQRHRPTTWHGSRAGL